MMHESSQSCIIAHMQHKLIQSAPPSARAAGTKRRLSMPSRSCVTVCFGLKNTLSTGRIAQRARRQHHAQNEHALQACDYILGLTITPSTGRTAQHARRQHHAQVERAQQALCN